MNSKKTGRRHLTYDEKVTDLIKRRASCRNYESREIEEEKRAALRVAFAACPPSPFGHRAKFYLVGKEDRTRRKVPLGTYGMIKNPQYFLVGTLEEGDRAYESYGYLFEQIILKATELDLATCWLGYFHKRSAFRRVPLAPGEVLPALSPVGYGAPDRPLYDRFVHMTISPRKRRPWGEVFFLEDMKRPLREEDAGPYAVPLEMVRIAPSAGNRQPWRIMKEAGSNRFHFYLDRANTRKGYEKRNLPRIDMGIAMCHFELTCTERNLAGRWERNPPTGYLLPSSFDYVASWHGEEGP